MKVAIPTIREGVHDPTLFPSFLGYTQGSWCRGEAQCEPTGSHLAEHPSEGQRHPTQQRENTINIRTDIVCSR